MKLQEYKKLEREITEQDFNKSYKNVNILMFILSLLGHIASIFLAYFMMSKVLSGAMTNNPIVVMVSSIIILTGIELLKRDIFTKFSFQYLRDRVFNKSVAFLFFLSFFIIGISFYSSISGAKEFSSHSQKIEADKKDFLSKYSDSLNIIYDSKISSVESEIKLDKDKLDKKDKEQTDIESLQPLDRQQRERVKDLKEEKSLIKSDISKLESDITSIKSELSNKIKEKSDEVSKETDSKKDDNSKNSTMFIIISTIIEILILAGVYFNKYYKFRSFREFRDKIDKDVNYQKWMKYNDILGVIYNKDAKVNDKVVSTKNIIDLCKVNDVNVSIKDINDFIKISTSLGVIRTSGNARYISKSRDLSFDVLKNHFNIQ